MKSIKNDAIFVTWVENFFVYVQIPKIIKSELRIMDMLITLTTNLEREKVRRICNAPKE